MKKFLAMILALVMVLSLVACGNDDTAAEEGENYFARYRVFDDPY